MLGAFGIGLLFWTPVAAIVHATWPSDPNPAAHRTASIETDPLPVDDAALVAWLGANHVPNASVDRLTMSGQIWVRVSYRSDEEVEPPWRDLGYAEPKLVMGTKLPATPGLGPSYFILLLAACTNLGFLVMGWDWARVAKPFASTVRFSDLWLAAAMASVVIGLAWLLSGVPYVGDRLEGVLAWTAFWPPGMRISTVIAMTLLVPLAQELFFRGRLFSVVSPAGTVRCLLATSGLYAACQLWLGAFLPAFCLGLTLGWLRQRTGKIWAPLIANFLFHAVAVTLPLVPTVSYTEFLRSLVRGAAR